MKTKYSAIIIGNVLLLAGVCAAQQVTTQLPLRYGSDGVAIYNGVAHQTIESSFGTNLLGLPFTGTTTYDFYSPRLATDFNLVTPTDKANATIFLQNSGTTSANNFHVTGRMRCYDYDPATGTEVLFVDTGGSEPVNVQHGETTHWNLNAMPLPADYVFKAGHQMHIALTITLTFGNPGNWAQVLYNGPSGTSTVVMLPQNDPLALVWPFDLSPYGVGERPVLSINRMPDGAAQLGGYSTAGVAWRVLATTNLSPTSTWTTIGTNLVAPNGVFTFTDRGASEYPCRFYRLVFP
ncbi:MAG TPA: hypothetical protein VKA67_06740 [Verrucomicrobiae bacterium]|nr:hypothetical protein [Verrucomicrobiae bacterium]